MDALIDVGQDRTGGFDVDFEKGISRAAGAELAGLAGESIEVCISVEGRPLQIHRPHQRCVFRVDRRFFEERRAGGEKWHQHKGTKLSGLDCRM